MLALHKAEDNVVSINSGSSNGLFRQKSGSAIDTDETLDDHSAMENVSRPELEAKLEAIEARMDGRVASMEGKIDALFAKLDAREAVAEQREKSAEVRAQAAESRMGRIESETTAIRGDMKSLKTTIITTAVASVLAIVFGVAAFNATLLSNMVASFESGKSTATAVVQATEQMKQTQEQLKAIQDRLDQQSRQKPAK